VEQIIISLSQEELSMSETQSVTPKPTSIQLQKIADEMENKCARDILKWAIDTYGLKIGLASSFGAEDVVLIDMMININKVKTKIFTLDTGRLDQET
jgi:phosphoadenosine phosphosulfate reductase